MTREEAQTSTPKAADPRSEAAPPEAAPSKAVEHDRTLDPSRVGPDREEPYVKGVLRWVVAAFVVALLAYPIVRRIQSQPPGSEQAVPVLQVPPGKSLLNVSDDAYQAGRYDESIAASKAMLAMDPKSAEAYNNLAVAYLKLQRWDDAIRSAEEAIRLKPDFELAKNNLAWIRRGKANASGAIPAVPAPNTPEYFLDLSLRHFQAGRWRECIAAAREALKLKPDMAEAYNNIAVGYVGLGQWDEAIAAAREALRLKPDYLLAKNNLAWALDEQKKAREKESRAKSGAPASTRE